MGAQKKTDLKKLTDFHLKIKLIIDTIIDFMKDKNNQETELQKCMFKLSYTCENYITDMEIILNKNSYSEIALRKEENKETITNLQNIQSKIRDFKNYDFLELKTLMTDWYETNIIATGQSSIQFLQE